MGAPAGRGMVGKIQGLGGREESSGWCGHCVRDQAHSTKPGTVWRAVFPRPVLVVKAVASLAQTGLLLTARGLQPLDQTARLLLDALLHTTLAHAEVSQCSQREPPELSGSFPAAERHPCEGTITGGER